MSDTVPSWVADSSFITAVALSAGDPVTVPTTLDLTAKFGAWLTIEIARMDGTAVVTATPIKVRVDKDDHSRIGGTETADTTSVDALSETDNVLNVADTAGFAVDDKISVGATDGSRLEFHVVSEIDAGVSLKLVEPLAFTHTLGQADIVCNKADTFRQWVASGQTYNIAFDYAGAATGPDVVARAVTSINDKLVTT